VPKNGVNRYLSWIIDRKANGKWFIPHISQEANDANDMTLCHRNCGEGEPRHHHEELLCFFIREEPRRRHRGRRPEGGARKSQASGSAAGGCTTQRVRQGQTRADAGRRAAGEDEGEGAGAAVPWSEMNGELGKVRA